MNELGLVLVAGAARCLALAMVGAALCVAIRRRGPATVALAVQATLTGLVVLAALAPFSWPRWWIVQAPAAARVGPAATELVQVPHPSAKAQPAGTAAPASGPTAVAAGAEAAGASWTAAFVAEFNAAARRPAAAKGWHWPAWVAMAYLAGALALLARLGMGVAAVGAVRRRARPIDDPGLLELIETLRAELGVAARVEARESAEVGMPATIGWRRPALLLPADWREWGETERRAVLAHELAHVRRGDYAAGVWAQCCVACHFYQPLAHWLAARLRLQQELAADAWGARFAGGNEPYLQTLARLALRRDDRPAAWPARAFFPIRGTLIRRIEMLRDAKTTGDLNPKRRILVLTLGALAAAGLFLAGLRGPLAPRPALAQERPRPVQAGKPAAGAGAFDLSLVPADAGMVVVVRPADLVARLDFQKLAELLGPESPFGRQLGIGLERLEEVTFLLLCQADAPRSQGPTLPPATAVVVRTVAAEDSLALARALVARPEEVPFADQKYVRHAGEEDRLAYARIDGRTIVVAGDTQDLRRYMTERLKGGRQDSWDDAWDTIAKGQAALAIDASFLVQGFMPKLAGPDAATVDVASPLWTKARAHALSLDGTKGVALEAASACNSDDGAEIVRKTLETLTTLANNALPGLRQRVAERPQAARAVAVLGLADDLLRSATIERTGRIVRLRAASGADVAALVNDIVLSAMAAGRSASRRAQSKFHLKQLGNAMYNYANMHGHLPPAVVIGPDGKTPHSWRVELLPFLDQDLLYKQYKLDEPWDSPSNRKLLEARPEVFGFPDSDADPTHAAYFVVVGSNTIFPPGGKGTRIAEIIDGISNTIMLVEARRPVPWTKPEDIPFDPEGPLPKFGGFQPESHGFNACLADGAVRFIKDSINPDLLKALLSENGGDPVNGLSPP